MRGVSKARVTNMRKGTKARNLRRMRAKVPKVIEVINKLERAKK
jgi:hypothetical protein